MALTSKIIFKKKTSTRSGYDIKVDYTDIETGIVHSKIFYYASEIIPDDIELLPKITYLASNIQDRIDNPPLSAWDRERIENLLVEYEYILAEQHIEDLCPKSELLLIK